MDVGKVRFPAPAVLPLAATPALERRVRCIEEEACRKGAVGGGLLGGMAMAGLGAGVGYLASQGACPDQQDGCVRENAIAAGAIGWVVGAPLGAWVGSGQRTRLGSSAVASAGLFTAVAGLALTVSLHNWQQGRTSAGPRILAYLAVPTSLVGAVWVGLEAERPPTEASAHPSTEPGTIR